VRVHKECRAPARDGGCRAQASDGADRAGALATASPDPELRELFARAAAQARELVDDLQRLQSLAGDTGTKPGAAQR
jgi:hypothetical protein